MIHNKRHTKQFCILSGVAADIAKIVAFFKSTGDSMVAVASHGTDEYMVRTITPRREIYDIVVWIAPDGGVVTREATAVLTLADVAHANRILAERATVQP